MAEKKVIGNLKLRIPAGRATAGPPVGSTLGQWGLNMMDFINPFNEATKDLMGKNVIVHIRVFEDRTFDWKSKITYSCRTSDGWSSSRLYSWSVGSKYDGFYQSI